MAVSYFILVASEAHKNRTYFPSALELTKYRIKQKTWGLKTHTRHRSSFKENDYIIFYISGKRELSKCFVGSAQVSYSPIPNKSGYKIDAPDIGSSVCSEYKMGLKNISLFNNPVEICDIINKLFFVSKNRNYWWVFFQGGAVKITQRDYNLINRYRRDSKP